MDENEEQGVVDEQAPDAGGTEELGTDDVSAGIETETMPEPSELVESPALSDELTQRAKDYGFAAETFAGMDDAVVSNVLNTFDQRLAGMQPQPPTDGAPGQPSAQPQQQQGAPFGAEFKPLVVDFGEELDEGLVKSFGGMVDGLNGQLKELHQVRQAIGREVVAINQLREFDSLDRFIESLGEEWTDVYGKGRTQDMNPQSAEFRKRIEMGTGGNAIGANMARINQPMRQWDAWQRGHYAVNHERLAEMERKKQDGRRKGRQARFSEPPQKGKTPTTSNREAAEAAWSK